MDVSSDIDAVLSDFGVSVSDSSVAGLGILDMPDMSLGSNVQSTEYSLLCRTDLFGLKKVGETLTVDGEAYKVRDNMKVDDGKLCRITLTKT